MEHIHSYYSPNDLYNSIIIGLNAIGKDLSKATLDDLQPVDEFHIRGDTATKELIKLSSFKPYMHILDVGCGIGGSTRRLSHEIGCFVTGIDLSNEYIDAAESDVCQDRCRVSYAAASLTSSVSSGVLSGFSHTAPTGDQFLTAPLQRFGWRCLACS